MSRFQDTRRGDIWYADETYGFTRNPESNVLRGQRPVLVVSSDDHNGAATSNTVTVVPLSSAPRRVHTPYAVDVTGATRLQSWAVVSQIATIDRAVLTSYQGRVTDDQLRKVNEQIKAYIGGEH